MNRIKLWLRAIRAPFFTATVTSGVLGSICAWNNTENFNWLLFFLTVLGIILLNTGTNLVNDYFDHTSGLDEMNTNPTRFSGGSRVIQDKLISPKRILFTGLAAFIVASIIGLYLNYKTEGNTILIIGIIGIFLGYFYSADPLRLGYTPLAEFIAGFCCGPLIVVGSYCVQAQAINFEVLLISVPIGILVFLILLINEFPDYPADHLVNKNTLVVVLGKEKASKVYLFLIWTIYLIIVFGIVFGIIPAYTLIALLTVPITLKAVKGVKMNFNRIQELLSANEATINLHLSFGLLVSGAYILDKLF